MVCSHCLFTFSKKYISGDVITHNVGEGCIRFWADSIGTLVAMGNIKLPLTLNFKNIL